ncbi:unnamed protein product [Periconia digitata]|uniref:Uncharacterized protein n=1 Tax=Periconia digitata TaxID=1303443 RepID=A0A9W4UQ74_9PLEO|nr:unnamed protein product [Periconia digitata]
MQWSWLFISASFIFVYLACIFFLFHTPDFCSSGFRYFKTATKPFFHSRQPVAFACRFTRSKAYLSG